MPNKNTFSIKPIKEFILSNLPSGGKIIDPFANICPLKEYFAKFEYTTNDLDDEMPTDYHLDALDFLKTLPDNCADMVLFDPPFSPRQVSESYKRLGKTVNMETTQASFWGNLKNEIARITKQNGIVFSFGWNSNGIGLKNGFVQKKILMVAHGGNHNDTICILEAKENGNNWQRFRGLRRIVEEQKLILYDDTAKFEITEEEITAAQSRLKSTRKNCLQSMI